MGQLYNIRVQLETIINERGLDPFKVKGKISLKSGVFISGLEPCTPDDHERIQKLKTAAEEILGLAI